MLKKIMSVIMLSCMATALLVGCNDNGAEDGKEKLVIWTNMAVEAETIQKYATLWGDENGYEVEEYNKES